MTAPSAHGDGIRPVVVEANGRCAPVAVALIHHLLHHHADALVAAWHMQWAQAIQHVRKAFWGPLSVSLLKLPYAAWSECSMQHNCHGSSTPPLQQRLPLADADLLAKGLAELMDAEMHDASPPPRAPRLWHRDCSGIDQQTLTHGFAKERERERERERGRERERKRERERERERGREKERKRERERERDKNERERERKNPIAFRQFSSIPFASFR